MLIGRPIVILHFPARKTTAEGAEDRRVFNRLFPLRVPLRTLQLNSRFGYSTPLIRGSSCTVKSHNSGFRYLSSYRHAPHFHAAHLLTQPWTGGTQLLGDLGPRRHPHTPADAAIALAIAASGTHDDAADVSGDVRHPLRRAHDPAGGSRAN
ncbi:MAG: hypothetical protein C5S48_02055 [Candidatus Methanogaster sp.]|nr:MAG: hypothetical protein C5S48_02055 [ANME-2 cluster archaeon]